MKWNSQQTARLIELSKRGLSARQIAERMKITRNTVLGKLHRLKMSIGEKRNPPPKKTAQIIIDLYEAGDGFREIAARLGISESRAVQLYCDWSPRRRIIDPPVKLPAREPNPSIHCAHEGCLRTKQPQTRGGFCAEHYREFVINEKRGSNRV